MPKKKTTIAELSIMEKPHEARLTIVGGSAGLQTGTPSAKEDASKSKKVTLDKQDGDSAAKLEDEASGDETDSPQRFRMIGYSGAPISRWYGKLVIDLAGMSSTGLPLPALLSHNSDAIPGVIDVFDITDAGLVEEGNFIQSEAGDKILSEMGQGVPYKASIGVQCLKAAWLDDELTLEINGQEIVGPAEIWLESEVYETSFTVIPADSNTSVDILSTHQPIQEATMPKPADGKTVKSDAEKAALENESGTPQPENVGLSNDEVLSLAANGTKLGLSIEDVKELAKIHTTPEALGMAMLKKAADSNPQVSSIQTLSMGADESERFNNAVADGLLMAHGHKFGDTKPAEGAADFKRMGLQQILRECLNQMGHRDAYRISSVELATRVMTLKSGMSLFNHETLNYGSSASTGDFAMILGSVIHRRLIAAYEESPATWQPIVNVTTAQDFRDIYGISLSEAPDLLEVKPGGEYKEAYFKDKQEVYSVSKHGRICSLTFEMIVNDDLRAFMRVPQLMGNAARRLESDMVWAKLLSNPVMAEDGVALFHADHRNLLTAAKITSASMDLAYQALMMQRGFNPEAGQFPKKKNAEAGALLNLIPKFLAVPPALKSTAQVLIRSLADPSSSNSGVTNVYQDDLDIIVEPRLQSTQMGGTAKNWFLSADPSQIDTIEVAYLEGEENPLLVSYEPFESDGVSWKIRHIFGVGAMDFRGLQKNPGL